MKKLLIAAVVAALLIICVSGLAGSIATADPGEPTASLTLDVEETGRPVGVHELTSADPAQGCLLPEPPAGTTLELSCGQSLPGLLRNFEEKFGGDAACSVHPISTLGVGGEFDENQAFWLRQNANRYGWILSGNQSLRYVGIPHAFLMRAKNLTLPQYLDYLRGVGGVTVHLNEQTYVVGYYPSGSPVFAPEGDSSVSGDGTGGFVVTTLCLSQSRSR